MTSPVSFIRAGISEPGFSHILSFRRQAYVSPEELRNLPDRLQIEYDGSTYWIYISTDNMTCFLCKKEGHVANKCPENTSSSSRPKNDNLVSTNIVPDTCPIKIFKRPHPPTTDSSQSVNIPMELSDTEEMSKSESEYSDISTDRSVNLTAAKKRAKKQKKSPPLDLQPTELDVIKNTLESSDYPMSINEFINFLEDSYGKENVLQISLGYTENIDSLIKMFKDIIPNIISRNVKNRITRIIKKLSS